MNRQGEITQFIYDSFVGSPFALHVYYTHVTLVAAKVRVVAERLRMTEDELTFVVRGALLHDIGVSQVTVPNWEHEGVADAQYIQHGVLGSELLRENGFEEFALFCERHTGVGISKEEILKNDLPLPHRDMVPETQAERLVAYADKFFSKKPLSLYKEKTIDEIVEGLRAFGEEKVLTFMSWVEEFEPQKNY